MGETNSIFIDVKKKSSVENRDSEPSPGWNAWVWWKGGKMRKRGNSPFRLISHQGVQGWGQGNY